MDSHKIITCTGYGGTGSSIITDLLKEFKNVKSLGDFEFSLAHEVDGISDLQHAIVDDFHRNKVDEAIYRFKRLVKNLEKPYNIYFNNKFLEISDNYLKSLIDVRWEGFWHQHLWRKSQFSRRIQYSIPTHIQLLLHQFFGKSTGYEFVPSQKKSEIFLSYGKEKFFDATHAYVDSLFHQIDIENEYDFVALDQLVPCYNLERYLKYFNNLKIIIIDRDPRDLYLLNKLYWNEGWIPSEDINVYIKWFDLIRQHQQYENWENPDVIKIQFEDCIYDYENTLLKIIKFLGLNSDDHIRKRLFFNPDVSIKNTRLWEKEIHFRKETKLIEEMLNKFCYGIS